MEFRPPRGRERYVRRGRLTMLGAIGATIAGAVSVVWQVAMVLGRQWRAVFEDDRERLRVLLQRSKRNTSLSRSERWELRTLLRATALSTGSP